MSEPRLLVVVHDVAAPFVREIEVILDELAPFDLKVVAALVPDWRGAGFDASMASLVSRFDEFLTHGLTHERKSGRLLSPISWATYASDELAGLRRDAAQSLLARALEETRRLTGSYPLGLLPPAWQISPGAARAAFDVGFPSLVGFRRIVLPHGQVPLRTWSWDWGRAGVGAAWIGERLQSGGQLMLPPKDCCIALHPADVRRGLMPRAVRIVRSLLEQGVRPLGVAGLLQELGAGRATG